MTRNGDFKKVVRARMVETGEGYVVALAAVRERPAPGMPSYDVARDEQQRAYPRRELVNYRYLERDAGRYRTAAAPPERMPVERQEIPAWEAVWLPGFLAGGS